MRKLAKKKTPWHRRRTPFSKTPDEIYYFDNLAEQRPKFRDRGDSNRYLDILTKSAALKASPSVVALISYSGEQEIIQGSGTVIENSDCGSIVLTSANLIRRPTDMGVMENILAENLKVIVHLCDGNSYEGVLCAHDFHYNLAAIKFQSETLVASATLARINDSISLAPNQNSFELRPHSNSSTLTPGDRVIALGRYFVKPFDLMAAPGEYWLERSSYDCKELFMAKCVITRCGDGGPLINDSGEVIGITYYDYGLTPFMPINIAYKWWQYYKAYGKYCRPSLGMEATDLYAVDLAIIERVILKFPSVSKGVIVEKVIPGSSADLAGICVNDVIVKCGGKTVQSLLQEQWKKVIARKLIQHGNTQHKLKPEIVTKCCARILCGGVYRMKEHWIGGRRNAKKCTRAPGDVRKEMEEYMEAKKKAREMENYFQAVIDSDEDSVDDIMQVSKSNKGSCASTPSLKTKVSTSRPKGPLDLYMIPDPETAVMKRKGKGQQKINENDNVRKELRARACTAFARWMYDAGIPFNAVNYDSFPVMVEAFGQYGPNMKPPSYHEVRVPLLKKEVDHLKSYIVEHEKQWEKFGCSLMCDGWTDGVQRSLINFLVNSPKGSVFIESVDSSAYSKTGEKMYELLCGYIEKIGPSNVVQVVTDSASNNKLAGKLLEVKFPHLFWTPCAAHCLDLILEDIFKLKNTKKTFERAVKLNSYIYTRPPMVNMLREFTNERELIRPAKTRFATAFLTLDRIHNQQSNLRKMFGSEKWLASKYCKERTGKDVAEIVFMPSFWNSVVFSLKVAGPLVHVLRMVDGERRPAMGYIYEAMDRAKEAIAKAFQKNEKKYSHIFEIIDQRWNVQLHQPLHAAGYYLNPEFYYSNLDIESDQEVIKGLYTCIEKMVPNQVEQDRIADQIPLYRNAEDLFGISMARRQRTSKSPAEWWKSYGGCAPDLQKLAIKILSLTCSSSGCERNWSTFQHLHSKKRNRLAQQRLNDLVFVKYNRALKRRYALRDTIDPISLSDIDESNEWLMGKLDDDQANDYVFDDDEGLTWQDVATATGAGEARYNSRSQTASNKKKGKQPCEPSTSFPLIDEDEEEELEFEGGNHSNDVDDFNVDHLEDEDED